MIEFPLVKMLQFDSMQMCQYIMNVIPLPMILCEYNNILEQKLLINSLEYEWHTLLLERM